MPRCRLSKHRSPTTEPASCCNGAASIVGSGIAGRPAAAYGAGRIFAHRRQHQHRLVRADRRADVPSLRRPAAGARRGQMVAQPAAFTSTVILCYSFQLLECTNMAKSVNKVILLGNVGKDPEIRSTPSGTIVANFALATSDRFQDAQGNWQDRTEWHNLVAFKRTAEIIRDYVKKGSKLYIEGKLRPAVGTTRSPARSATRPRSSSSTSRCSPAAKRAQAAYSKAASSASSAASFDQRPHQLAARRTTTANPPKSPTTIFRSKDRGQRSGVRDQGCQGSGIRDQKAPYSAVNGRQVATDYQSGSRREIPCRPNSLTSDNWLTPSSSALRSGNLCAGWPLHPHCATRASRQSPRPGPAPGRSARPAIGFQSTSTIRRPPRPHPAPEPAPAGLPAHWPAIRAAARSALDSRGRAC